MNKLLKLVFTRRGYTEEFFKDIENPVRDALMDMDRLCESLHDIQTTGKHLVLLPDYDMDGCMSGVLGFAGFAELGFNISLFLPDPADGYGFDERVMKRLLSEYPDTDAIITADTGISCYEGIAYAKKKGIPVFVTDHHKQEDDGFLKSEADIIVNPMRVDESYSHPKICGAYVLFQVLETYAERYCDVNMQEQIQRLRVFAGIGTVSDMMPLFWENRSLVSDTIGISRMLFSAKNALLFDGCDIYRRAFYGLHIALQLYKDEGILLSSDSIREDFFGYYLAPTFNSVKRMNGSMATAFGVFFGVNPEEDMKQLFALNVHRKELVSEYMNQILGQKNPYAPYIYLSDAPAGILGLLATKLISDSGLPTLVIRKDGRKYHGSGRSPEWFLARKELLDAGFYAAGHDTSFGIGITDTKELKSIFAFLNKRVSDVISEEDLEIDAVNYDLLVTLDGTGDTGLDIELFSDYVYELEKYRPFGNHFPEPVICFRFSPSDAEWKTLGSEKQHIKLFLPNGFELLSWNAADKIETLQSKEGLTFTGKVSKNVFMDKVTIQFVGDLR